MFFKSSLLPAGPVPHPSAPPSDAGDIPTWNSDDERDFAEHAYSPPSPMSHYPGSLNPLHQFLSHIPDWNSFDESALDHALEGLPVPIPGPAPRGISLQEAINVSPPIRAPPIPPHTISYTISYILLYRIRYRIQHLIRCADTGWIGSSFTCRGGIRLNIRQ